MTDRWENYSRKEFTAGGRIDYGVSRPQYKLRPQLLRVILMNTPQEGELWR